MCSLWAVDLLILLACCALECKMLEMVRVSFDTQNTLSNESNGAFISFVHRISKPYFARVTLQLSEIHAQQRTRKLCTTISLSLCLFKHKTFRCTIPYGKVTWQPYNVPSSFLVLIYHNFLNAVRSNLISVLFIVCFGFKDFSLFSLIV